MYDKGYIQIMLKLAYVDQSIKPSMNTVSNG